MPRRKSYDDTRTVEADKAIRDLLSDPDDNSRTRRVLLKIIKNELTPRQKEIIVLYYFRELDTSEIARLCNISPQAVSALMARARKRIFRIMKYTLLK